MDGGAETRPGHSTRLDMSRRSTTTGQLEAFEPVGSPGVVASDEGRHGARRSTIAGHNDAASVTGSFNHDPRLPTNSEVLHSRYPYVSHRQLAIVEQTTD